MPFSSHGSIDYAHDHEELGAALNGFSLNETGQLAPAIEKTGQAIDVTYMSTTKLVRFALPRWYRDAISKDFTLDARVGAKLGRTFA